MFRAAQILAGLMAVFLIFLGGLYAFNPDAASSANQLNPETLFGKTNIRVMAAPMLMMGILAAIGAVRADWKLVLPAALYFLLVIIIRIIGLVADGFDTGTIRGLVLATVLFVVAEVAVQVFRKSERRQAEG